MEVGEVNGLVNRFFDARKMMSSLASGKMPGMPGLPSMPGSRRPAAKQQKKKGGRGVSGNPAKRNAPGQLPAAANSGEAFGAGQFDEAALQKAMADFELPPELRSRFSK